MWRMRTDMSGAAAAAGAVLTLAKREAPVNAVAVLALAENMPDGNAIRPGDVLTSMSGKTIEVLNTDAEGRLVLADALWWAQDTYKPRLAVTIATLTGAVVRALGSDHAGVFTHDDVLADRVIAAGEAAGERLWRLPVTAGPITAHQWGRRSSWNGLSPMCLSCTSTSPVRHGTRVDDPPSLRGLSASECDCLTS
jgi:leucyl aminopeptidase